MTKHLTGFINIMQTITYKISGSGWTILFCHIILNRGTVTYTTWNIHRSPLFSCTIPLLYKFFTNDNSLISAINSCNEKSNLNIFTAYLTGVFKMREAVFRTALASLQIPYKSHASVTLKARQFQRYACIIHKNVYQIIFKCSIKHIFLNRMRFILTSWHNCKNTGSRLLANLNNQS